MAPRVKNTMESDALRLATNGFSVFPIEEGAKNPPKVKFASAATSDPVRVSGWWKKYPNANIGARMGGGTLALDVDTPEAARFVADFDLPHTTTVRTPSGGSHYYLLGHSPTRTAIRSGLDVRGSKGYVVAPASRIKAERYEWEVPPWEVLPQPAPPEVLSLVRERVRRQALDASPIPEGRRTNTLVRIAGYFVGHDVRGEPLAVALQAVNRQRCKPPLTEPEVEKIVHSASKWDAAPMWVSDPLTYAEDDRLDTKARLLLFVLTQRADHDGLVRGGVWLQRVTNLSKNGVSRAVVELEAAKRVRVRRKPKHPNLYELLPPPSSSRSYPQWGDEAVVA